MLQIISSVYQLKLCRFSGYARSCIGVRVISGRTEHCRANLDFGRATVERRILSVTVNHKLVLWLVTVEQIGYGPKVTSPTRNEDKLDSDVISLTQTLRRSTLVLWRIISRGYV